MRESYKRTSNYKCDYCGKEMYLRPSEKEKCNTHTCSKKCNSALSIHCPSPTYIMELVYKRDTTVLEISKMFNCSRCVINTVMKRNNIPIRGASEDNKRRYKNMSSKQIKEQTKAANIKRRELDRKSPEHKLAVKRSCAARRRARKLNQTPILTEHEKLKVELYYKISVYLGEDWHVDHIIPLSKGGLHHPDNLQVIPARDNLKKNNKLDYIVPKHLVVRI